MTRSLQAPAGGDSEPCVVGIHASSSHPHVIFLRSLSPYTSLGLPSYSMPETLRYRHSSLSIHNYRFHGIELFHELHPTLRPQDEDSSIQSIGYDPFTSDDSHALTLAG